MINYLVYFLDRIYGLITRAVYFGKEVVFSYLSPNNNAKILISSNQRFLKNLKVGFSFTPYQVKFAELSEEKLTNFDLVIPITNEDLRYLNQVLSSNLNPLSFPSEQNTGRKIILNLLFITLLMTNNQWKIRNYYFDWGSRTYIMGIINITPDSFSDGGQFQDIGKAVNHALEMEKQGVDIIDIGGQSTRPNAQQISLEEELN